jgi:tryptophanyl-tRNA synthetase
MEKKRKKMSSNIKISRIILFSNNEKIYKKTHCAYMNKYEQSKSGHNKCKLDKNGGALGVGSTVTWINIKYG